MSEEKLQEIERKFSLWKKLHPLIKFKFPCSECKFCKYGGSKYTCKISGSKRLLFNTTTGKIRDDIFKWYEYDICVEWISGRNRRVK